MSEVQSPLKSADPKVIQELFERDPEELSNSDVATIVTELRLQRQRFQQDEDAKALKGKRKVGTKSPPPNISLSDINL